MKIKLEDIDTIRQRTGVSYREAKEALEKADGDVVDALILLEEKDRGQTTWQERIQVTGQELVARVKELIREGNVTNIRIRQGDQVLLEIPVTVGALGAIMLPSLAALGVVAALVARCTIEVERTRDEHGPGDAGEDIE